MSAETSRSRAGIDDGRSVLEFGPLNPGATKDHPVWMRETTWGAHKMAARLDVALKLLTVAYALLAAWQVAKALNPPLQVRQDIIVAAARRKIARAAAELPGLGADDMRKIYDDTR